jgi:hypothetical protein
MRRLMVDSWLGPRPERATWRPKKREAALSPAIRQKKAFREKTQRQKEQVLVSGLILDRWIKGQKVWAKWPGNREEYQGTVEEIRGNQLRIVWNDGDTPTWVDIKDVWPKRCGNSTTRVARVIAQFQTE